MSRNTKKSQNTAEQVVESMPVKANNKKSSPFKKRLLKYLLLVVIAGIIGLVIACIKYFGTDKQQRYAVAVIEFNYDGAAQNQTPSGEKFSVSSITSDSVIAAALEACGMTDKYSIDSIQKSIVVKGSYPDDIVDRIKAYDSRFDFSASREISVNDYYPTIYSLTLYDDFDGNVSSTDLSKLSTAIISAFKSFFMKEYVNAFDMSKFDSMLPLAGYDYAQRIKVLNVRTDMIRKYASELYQKKADFKYNGMSFNDLYTKCNDIKNNSLTKADALVTMNALSIAPNRLKNQYQYEIQLLENELKNKTEELAEIDKLIEGYQTDDILYISSSDAVTKIDSNSTKTYEELMDIRLEITERITEINADLDKYKLNLSDITTNKSDDALNSEVKSKIDEVAALTDVLEQEFKAMVLAYNDTLVSDQSIAISDAEYSAPKLLSGSFVVMAVKCAGPICIIVMIICCLHGFVCEIKKYRIA